MTYTAQKQRLPLLRGSDSKFTFIIPDNVGQKIRYICSKCPNKEWSGPMYCKVDGTINDLETLTITMLDFFPMHIGTGGSTEYEFDEKWAMYMAKHDELTQPGVFMGHIHSHHNMRAYFSTVDDNELIDSATNRNSSFISLIVNNSEEYVVGISTRVNNIIPDTTCIRRCKSFGETPLEWNGSYEFSERDSEGNIIINSYIEKLEGNIEMKREGLNIDTEFSERVSELLNTTSYNGSYNNYQKNYDNYNKNTKTSSKTPLFYLTKDPIAIARSVLPKLLSRSVLSSSSLTTVINSINYVDSSTLRRYLDNTTNATLTELFTEEQCDNAVFLKQLFLEMISIWNTEGTESTHSEVITKYLQDYLGHYTYYSPYDNVPLESEQYSKNYYYD